MDASSAPSELFRRLEAGFLRQGLMRPLGALGDMAGGHAAVTRVDPDAEVTAVAYKINCVAGLRDGALRAVGRGPCHAGRQARHQGHG